jgi:hypothetical protein
LRSKKYAVLEALFFSLKVHYLMPNNSANCHSTFDSHVLERMAQLVSFLNGIESALIKKMNEGVIELVSLNATP